MLLDTFKTNTRFRCITGGLNSRAWAINDTGTAVGYSELTAPAGPNRIVHATQWSISPSGFSGPIDLGTIAWWLF
ncbi:hypothetical protein ACLBXI_28790 [Bacillus cereus]